MKVDIVGGSFAGLSTAITIKKLNKKIDVTIHEKHNKIGYNHEGRRCGEAHTIEEQWNKWIPEEKCIYNEITRGEINVGNQIYTYPRIPGTAFILNRPEFIAQIGRQAEDLEVNIQTNDKIKSIKDLNSDYIVDASGCPSIIKRELGFKKGIKGVTCQQTIENSNFFIKDTIKIYYIGKLGYYWIFPRDPQKKEINLGVGFFKDFNYNLREFLEDFKIKHKITGKVNYKVGGLLPIGLQRPFKYKNILFVGDSGVGAFPFNGQGIYRALLCGEFAGKCIALNQADKYPKIIGKEFIKWDILGKLFIYPSYFFSKINPDIVLKNLNLFIRYGGNISH